MRSDLNTGCFKPFWSETHRSACTCKDSFPSGMKGGGGGGEMERKRRWREAGMRGRGLRSAVCSVCITSHVWKVKIFGSGVTFLSVTLREMTFYHPSFIMFICLLFQPQRQQISVNVLSCRLKTWKPLWLWVIKYEDESLCCSAVSLLLLVHLPPPAFFLFFAGILVVREMITDLAPESPSTFLETPPSEAHNDAKNFHKLVWFSQEKRPWKGI